MNSLVSWASRTRGSARESFRDQKSRELREYRELNASSVIRGGAAARIKRRYSNENYSRQRGVYDALGIAAACPVANR
jgi:hypothetical protein